MACGGDLEGGGGLTESIETPLQVCELLLVISGPIDLVLGHRACGQLVKRTHALPNKRSGPPRAPFAHPASCLL